MKITPEIALEVLHHEAIIRQAYKDSKGIWTWSGGITSASGHSVERYKDNPQSMRKCIEVYLWLLERYAEDVRYAFLPRQLTQAEFAAALSFHWNTGAIKRATWVENFRAGDFVKAKKNFMNYRKPSEIIPRRKAERDLFFNGKWSSNGTTTEFTRVTKSYSPVWASAVNVDVLDLVNEILSGAGDNEAPVSPKPTQNPWAGLFVAFAGLFRRNT